MSLRALMIEMFDEMVAKKNIDLVPHYYHPDFRLWTNGLEQDYAGFLDGHRTVYATEISYRLRYDDETWVENGDRLAVRLWIATERPGEAPVEFEIVLIAIYKDARIWRLWETTSPDWRKERAFEDY